MIIDTIVYNSHSFREDKSEIKDAFSGTLAWHTRNLSPSIYVRRSSQTPLSQDASKAHGFECRIYCLSPGQAWFHQFLIDRFSPRLVPHQRWIRATSRSDLLSLLRTRTKFFVWALLSLCPFFASVCFNRSLK